MRDVKCIVCQVPGIGAANEQKLIEAGISTTFGLIGKYLSLKEAGVESVEHCDRSYLFSLLIPTIHKTPISFRFWFWLQSIGVNAGRNSIIQAIAEKMDVMFPGIYDKSSYN